MVEETLIEYDRAVLNYEKPKQEFRSSECIYRNFASCMRKRKTRHFQNVIVDERIVIMLLQRTKLVFPFAFPSSLVTP